MKIGNLKLEIGKFQMSNFRFQIFSQRLDRWSVAHPLLSDCLGAALTLAAIVTWTLLLCAL